MYNLSYCIISFIVSLNIWSQQPIDQLKIGTQIKFSSETYQLTRSAKPYNNYFIQEYIRSKENIDNFTKSIVVIAIIDTTTTDHMVGIKLNELKKLQEKDKSIKYQVFFNEGDDRIIEFSMTNNQFHFWNIQRYTVQKLNDGREVGIMYTYVEREKITKKWSLDNIRKNIKNKRVGYISEVGEIKIPQIKE